ncbi:MAG: hypothetical protein QGG64_13805 [Candidatus Latescibacteria bacterium]|nr:hypothetical protein [Candidatus Latescibacterota bacterium]
MHDSRPDRWSLIFVIVVGAITGICLQLHWFFARGDIQDISRAMFFLRVIVTGHIGAVLFWAVWRLERRVIAQLAIREGCKDRYLKYEVWPFAVFLLTLSGFVGVQLIFPVMAMLVGLFVLAQIVFIVGVQIAKKKRTFFYSFGWLLFLFLLSGCAALIYQVVWQRTLFAMFGVNIESVTVIVSVFMFGLGIGALLGGQLSERFAGRLPYLFMLCELMIGLFGLVSLFLIQAVGSATQGFGLGVVFLTTFALLCIPTILMGATLPILVAFLFAHFRQIGRTVGLLYFANTLGSALACFLTVDLLFAFWGQQAAVWVAAGFNMLVGMLVLVFARGVVSADTLRETP